MKQRILFMGQPSDPSLDKVLPEIIAKAKEVKETVFVRWNDVMLRVEADDNVEALMFEYAEKFRIKFHDDLIIKEARRQRLTEDEQNKHLYHVHNRLGDFYIVAHSFDEAKNELTKRLNAEDYGFTSDRKAKEIRDLAVQDIDQDKQSFSDNDGNLIILGDI